MMQRPLAPLQHGCASTLHCPGAQASNCPPNYGWHLLAAMFRKLTLSNHAGRSIGHPKSRRCSRSTDYALIRVANGGYAERTHDLCCALALCAAAVRNASLLVRAIDRSHV